MDGSDLYAAASDPSASEDEFAAPVGHYSGRIDVVVLRCYPSKPSRKTSSRKSSSTRNSGSSRRSSYIDEQEEPLMTGAMFDGAGDFPPPRDRKCPREDSCQGRVEGDEKDPQTFRLGGGLFFSRARGSVRFHPKKIEPQSPVSLRLRGGTGSEGKSTKKRSPSPALSSRSYQLGSGGLPSSTKTPKGSPDSHTPKNTWRRGRSKKSDNDTTGSYTPDNTWGNVVTVQADNQWQEKGTWTWEPGNNQRNVSNPTESWERTTDPKDDRITKDEAWNVNDAQADGSWDDTNDNDHQTGDRWNNAGTDDNGQQDGGWAAFESTGNDDLNGDQNDSWDNTKDNDQSHQDGNWKGTPDENDQRNDSGTGNDQNNAWSGSWESSEGKASEGKNPDIKQSPKVASKAGSPTNGSKARVTEDSILKAPSIFAPATKAPSSKRAASKAPSVISIRAALKSPFRSSWAPAKVSTPKIPDEVAKTVAIIPGAWSPPLEKKERKTRSESTKRRAAELNAQRARAHAAEFDTESVKAGSQGSKPTTSLPAANLKPVATSAAATPLTIRSKLFQTHRKQWSKSAEKDPIVADIAKDEGPSHSIRPSSPMSYTHKTCAPHYMDTLADPYAHFVFHYREKALISKMCDVAIVETKEELRSRLAGLTKQELLDLLVEEHSAADEEADEKMTWKTSPDKAGYEPNLNAANDKLDEWGNNQADSGGTGWGNQDSGGDAWGNSNDVSGGDGDNSSQVNNNNNDQDGNAWGNDNNDNNNSGDNDKGGNWDNSNNNNNSADGNVGWGNDDDNAVGNSNGGGGGGGGW